MAKLIIDQEKCIKCGTCAAIYSDYFEAKNDHFEAKKEVDVGDKEARSIIKACPVEAINIIKS